MWRRSWGSSASDQKDDFWSALQANYNYIMDNNLIDKCHVRLSRYVLRRHPIGRLLVISGSEWGIDQRDTEHLVTQRILRTVLRTLFLVKQRSGGNIWQGGKHYRQGTESSKFSSVTILFYSLILQQSLSFNQQQSLYSADYNMYIVHTRLSPYLFNFVQHLHVNSNVITFVDPCKSNYFLYRRPVQP